jgi:hypothetical protein
VEDHNTKQYKKSRTQLNDLLGNTIQQFETATKGQSKISKLAVSVFLEHRKGTKFFFPLSPHIFTWLPKKDCLIVKILCNSMTRSY